MLVSLKRTGKERNGNELSKIGRGLGVIIWNWAFIPKSCLRKKACGHKVQAA